MNIAEIDQSLDEISMYLGSQVQGVSFINETLILDLFPKSSIAGGSSLAARPQVLFYAKPPKAALVLLSNPLGKIKSVTKPLYLFAKAHLMGATLLNVERDEELGRVVYFDFIGTDEKSGKEVSIRLTQNLIPIAWNLSLQVGAKIVSLNKPKAVPTNTLENVPTNQTAFEVNLDKLKAETVDWVQGIKKQVKQKAVPSIEKEILKKQKLLKKMTEDIQNKKDLGYERFAELLLENVEQAQKQFPHYFDASKNIYVQQKDAYEKHKKNLQKLERMQARKEELVVEIQGLKSTTPEEWAKLHRQKQGVLLQKTKSKSVEARKYELAPDCVAYLGKSAQNNLLLLRQAKAWHYWLHIKDMPSAHVILQCPKNKKISYLDVENIIKWWRTASSSFEKSFVEGDKLSVLVTQCRYVRPIKGDKLGRVNYSHEQVFTISL